MPIWNPWHGCRKISPGCRNCYVYRRDALYAKDSSFVAKTRDFTLPVRRGRDGTYRLTGPETVYACLTSDFFLEAADAWRAEAWRMIRERRDLDFCIITKRIDRFRVNLPADWGPGYDHVSVGCTVEDQARGDARLPIFREAPIRHRFILCEPLLEPIRLATHLDGSIERVIAGGESGPDARVCDYAWVLDLREQCRERGVAFHFKQTGANFRKAGRVYRIPRRHQLAQAEKAGLDLP